jgi:hypothetical protein
MIRGEVQVVVTTADFRAGQIAAWEDYKRDPDSTPNLAALAARGPEFAAGYADEFDTFITPARNRERSYRHAKDNAERVARQHQH